MHCRGLYRGYTQFQGVITYFFVAYWQKRGILVYIPMPLITNNLPLRSVLLVPLNRIDTAEHIASKFELEATFEHHAILAMAEICLLHKQAQSMQAWNSEARTVQLVLVHAQDMDGIPDLLHAVRSYTPNVQIVELRDGQLEEVENHGEIIDRLEDHPVVQTENIDADELSMLLDTSQSEGEE